MAFLVSNLQEMDTIPFSGIGFEDGTMLAAVRSNGVIYAKVKDVQNVLGQGTGYRKYNIDPATSMSTYCLPTSCSKFDVVDCYDTSSLVEDGGSTYEPRLRGWYIDAKASGQAGYPPLCNGIHLQ